MSDSRFWKMVVVINGAVPLALLVWDAYHGELGPNGAKYAIHTTGILSLIFPLSLSITPVRLLTGWNTLVGFRRALGLFGAFYACAHLAIYYVFDREMSIGSTIHEIVTRRFLQVGFVAIVLMAPLAITSTNAMVARLGARRWKQLHRLAYVAASLGALHYYMQVKADVRQPLAFAAVLAVLLFARFAWHYVDLRKAVRRAPVAAAPSATRKFWSGELRVARVFDETPEVRTFRLVAPDGGPIPFSHLPGQYLNVQLSLDGHRVNRSYTIASPPTRNGYCEVSIKREDSGVVSKHLHAHAHEGDGLKISAPAGRFVFTGEEAESVVLIAGGVGITPMMSIVRYLTDHGWTGDIYLMFVVKTARDIIFRDELDLLQKRFPNLHVNVSLTRAGVDDAWTGQRGRVSREWLTRCVSDIARKPAYICGPDAMMSATRELLVALGLPESSIKIEAFVSPGVSVPVGERVNASDNARDATSGEEFTAAAATFARSGKTAQVTAGMTLLEASESIGVNLPFECRSGVCGQCRVKLIDGTVSMDAEDALSAAEIKAGWILACQSHPRMDVIVDA